MTTSRNDITGDPIITKNPSDAYRNGWDNIFGKKAEEKKEVKAEVKAEVTKTRKSKRGSNNV